MLVRSFGLTVAAVAIPLVLAALGAFGASPARQALWQTIRACVADFRLTGEPFPCLLVDLTGGEERGYVILRAPFGLSDTILAPTRKVVGVEDPWLQSPDAPNYFEAAWRARSLLSWRDSGPPRASEYALAVNSALTRSQDQLHIHMGCLVPATMHKLSLLPIGVWAQIDGVIPRAELWGLRLGRVDLVGGVKPFRLAADGLADRVRNRRQLMIFVTGIRVLDDELLFLASYAGVAGPPHYQVEAENILAPTCASQGFLG